MNARKLNEIDRDILEIRQYVEHQRDVIRQLATGGQSQPIPEAQKALEELQVKLEALLGRRKAAGFIDYKRSRWTRPPVGRHLTPRLAVLAAPRCWPLVQ